MVDNSQENIPCNIFFKADHLGPLQTSPADSSPVLVTHKQHVIQIQTSDIMHISSNEQQVYGRPAGASDMVTTPTGRGPTKLQAQRCIFFFLDYVSYVVHVKYEFSVNSCTLMYFDSGMKS